jgi:hypothetical protein
VYRFQLLCQLANPSSDGGINVLPEENVQALVDILEPWERDEIYSFYMFVDKIYRAVFNSIGTDLDPNLDPHHLRCNNQERPLTADEAFAISNLSKTLAPSSFHRISR